MRKECEHPIMRKGIKLNGNKFAYFYNSCKTCGEKWIDHELTERTIESGRIKTKDMGSLLSSGVDE